MSGRRVPVPGMPAASAPSTTVLIPEVNTLLVTLSSGEGTGLLLTLSDICHKDPVLAATGKGDESDTMALRLAEFRSKLDQLCRVAGADDRGKAAVQVLASASLGCAFWFGKGVARRGLTGSWKESVTFAVLSELARAVVSTAAHPYIVDLLARGGRLLGAVISGIDNSKEKERPYIDASCLVAFVHEVGSLMEEWGVKEPFRDAEGLADLSKPTTMDLGPLAAAAAAGEPSLCDYLISAKGANPSGSTVVAPTMGVRRKVSRSPSPSKRRTV
jgi:hypothetical protein